MERYTVVSEEFKEKAWIMLKDYKFSDYLEKCLQNGNLQVIFQLLFFNLHTNFKDEELKKLLEEKKFEIIKNNLDASNPESLALSKKCLELLMEINPRD